jgi:hypothetical protein
MKLKVHSSKFKGNLKPQASIAGSRGGIALNSEIPLSFEL